jgi:hypothetical protein
MAGAMRGARGGAIGLLYRERLSDADLAVLAEAAGEPGPARDRVARLRSDPDRIATLIERPRAYQVMFGSGAEAGLVFASPHLAFSVLFAAVSRELATVPFVREWVAPRRSVPIFDVVALRTFAEDHMRRLFLTDVLSSYTHVASGPVWIRTGRTWTRRRFSELDPMHLIRLIDATPDDRRDVLYRRLGDLSLFLSGVFPDHAAGSLFGGKVATAWRAIGGDSADGGADLGEPGGPIQVLEWLGRRSYRMVATDAVPGRLGMAGVLEDVAEGFSQARRVLNFLTERHLFPIRDGWFGPG